MKAAQQALGGTGLQRRLLLLLLAPLLLLALFNTWFDYQLADTAAIQQDRLLLTLVPQLADSIGARASSAQEVPPFSIGPEIADFLDSRRGAAAYALLNADGKVLLGDAWLGDYPPATYEPEFSSQEFNGVVYRIVSQRVLSAAGELTVRLADGANGRVQWLRRLWLRVLLPNVLLALGAAFAVNWAVRRALRPLLELKDAVEGRSPRDLTPLDASRSPDEVLPLVLSLNRLFALVNAQAESQRRFVADAAHQLRTPLAGLQAQVEAWAQMVDTQQPSAEACQSAEGPSAQVHIRLPTEQVIRLRESCRRTSKLANQLLALSRADAGRATPHPKEAVDLKKVSEQVFEEYLDAAAAKQLDFGLEAAALSVAGYEWLLCELIRNVIDNALKYTGQGGRVTLRCGVVADGQAGSAFLEVQDNGPGLAPAELVRVAARFYRVPGSPGAGNGLGLAIASEIAALHQATLTLSNAKVGSGIKVSLLFAAPQAPHL